MRAAGGREARPFPWGTVMTLGLFRLRLSPEVFWGLSLTELAAMAGAFGEPAGLSRGEVEALMRQFPD
ncbi:rcc01693 family protein [Allorhizobium sp. NPDC080224]|uniref:Phage tail assembly chaperone n=2 Tax=Rhizobium rosettiformans TaxID=1368430 RepID=A0ABX7EZ40_9HYPH|nr:phage tail assembly chaperone [Rhizobium rosettiformans]